MSHIGFCKRGGMEGIVTTKKEMYDFAVILQSQYADEFVPLPNVSVEEQMQKIESCEGDKGDVHNDVQYWETETGNHGWCCKKCGTVVQWG